MTTDNNDAWVEEIEARLGELDRPSRLPWKAHIVETSLGSIATHIEGLDSVSKHAAEGLVKGMFVCDAEFIANAPTDLRRLLDERKVMKAEAEAERKLKQGYYDEAVKGWTAFRAAEGGISQAIQIVKGIAAEGATYNDDEILTSIIVIELEKLITDAEDRERLGVDAVSLNKELCATVELLRATLAEREAEIERLKKGSCHDG